MTPASKPETTSPCETALQEVIGAWGAVHDEMVRSVLSLLSPGECEKLLRGPMNRAGARAAGAVEGRLSPGAIGQRIMAFEKHWNIEGRVLTESVERFDREVTRCPWDHFHPLSCRILGWYMEGFVQALNPSCTYSLPAMIPEGDSTCRWVIECPSEQRADSCNGQHQARP